MSVRYGSQYREIRRIGRRYDMAGKNLVVSPTFLIDLQIVRARNIKGSRKTSAAVLPLGRSFRKDRQIYRAECFQGKDIKLSGR